jgi:hypothetical protein
MALSTTTKYVGCFTVSPRSKDSEETFNPVIKPATVYVILSIMLSIKWETGTS